MATWGLALLPSLFVLGVAASHEAWRDEANWWLLGRDSDWAAWWQGVRFAGSPPLWYGLVRCFALLGLPIESQALANSTFCVVGVLLLAAVARRAWLPALLLVFNYFVLFDWGVVARSYGLGFLGIALLLWAWPSRLARPTPAWVGGLLLASSSAHALVLAAAAVAAHAVSQDDGMTRRARWTPLAMLVLVGGGSTLWSASADGFVMTGHAPSLQAVWRSLGEAAAPLLPWAWKPWLGVGATVLVGATTWRNRPALVWLVVSLGGLFAIFALVHGGMPRHYGFVWVSWSVALFLATTTEPTPGAPPLRIPPPLAACMILLAMASSWSAFQMGTRDLHQAFSGGREAAAWLDEVPSDVPVAVWDAALATSALAYAAPRAVWQLDRQAWSSFLPEDAAYQAGRNISPAEVMARASRIPSSVRPVLLLTRALPEQLAAQHGFQRAICTESQPFGARDEVYCLYVPTR